MEIIELGDRGINSRNEDWWSLNIDDNGKKYLVHRWSYLPFNGPIDSGERSILLEEAEGENYYHQALAAAAKWDEENQ